MLCTLFLSNMEVDINSNAYKRFLIIFSFFFNCLLVVIVETTHEGKDSVRAGGEDGEQHANLQLKPQSRARTMYQRREENDM